MTRCSVFPAIIMLQMASAVAVEFDSVFSAGMLIQRDAPVQLSGKGTPGNAVAVAIDAAAKTARVSDDGSWSVVFLPMAAGGPHVLTAEDGSNKAIVNDVLSGDVPLYSGQSNTPGAWLAVMFDTTDGRDLHPVEKDEIGRRLARLTRKNIYGVDRVASGPAVREVTVDGSRMRVVFDDADGLATADGKAPSGFSIAGVDGDYRFGDAMIDGIDRVVGRATPELVSIVSPRSISTIRLKLQP